MNTQNDNLFKESADFITGNITTTNDKIPKNLLDWFQYISTSYVQINTIITLVAYGIFCG